MAEQVATLREHSDLTGCRVPCGDRVDWRSIEEGLPGLSGLPDDYKAFVEWFGEGMFFDRLRVYRPGWANSPTNQYPESAISLLDTLRDWRSGGFGTFPYPLYPEIGGLLPCAWDRSGNDFFWLTDGDSGSWPVVWTDSDTEKWGRFEGSLTSFLVAFLKGEVESVFGPSRTELSRRTPYKMSGPDEWMGSGTLVTVRHDDPPVVTREFMSSDSPCDQEPQP